MSPKPLIAHVVNSLATGGLENGVVNIVNHAGLRFRHAVICMTIEGAFRPRVGPTVEVLAIHKKPGRDVRAFIRLVMLLRRLRPAIVHSRNWATFDAIPAAWTARVPVVIHGEHGRDISDPAGENRRRNRLRRALSPMVDRYVAVSDDLSHWLTEKVSIPTRKVITIPNGVDSTRFSGIGRSEARRRLGILPDHVVVGTVGRLDPVKDQASLVKAFATLRPTRPAALLIIVGDGPCRMELTNLVSDLGLGDRVLLLGERQDIPELMATMDVFVLPSIAEGMSNTVLEAMATGLPVVATRIGGNPELIEDGLTGRLVPPLEMAELASAIDGYLDDAHLRALHGKASRHRAVERFDLAVMARAYENLYDTVLGERSSRGA
jgi:sugar transferase (PEP-CTERM/EpsH1 system associated)